MESAANLQGSTMTPPESTGKRQHQGTTEAAHVKTVKGTGKRQRGQGLSAGSANSAKVKAEPETSETAMGSQGPSAGSAHGPPEGSRAEWKSCLDKTSTIDPEPEWMIVNDLPITKPLSVEEPSLTGLADDKTICDFNSTWDWKCYKYFLPRPPE